MSGYVALCVQLGFDGNGVQQWSAADLRVLKQFKDELLSSASARNKFAHDVWYIGWSETTGGDGTDVLSPVWRERWDFGKQGAIRHAEPTVTITDVDNQAANARRLRRIAFNLLSILARRCLTPSEACTVELGVIRWDPNRQ